MCGISAIASHKTVAEALLQGLRNLEYRGYDSCGMALQGVKGLEVRKNIGAVDEVDQAERFAEMQGHSGIAHTRWATHGEVTRFNSHPHLSNNGNFAIVHNGILSNYQEIKAQLMAKGFQFLSQTDTEVFANLLEDAYGQSKSVEQAFCSALRQVKGSYAIAMISQHEPGRIYGVKKDSPLVVGLSDGTNYLSSDINAFLGATRDTLLLEDHEYVVLEQDQVWVKSVATGELVPKQVIRVQWDRQAAQRGGFSHYMLKEIFDQPQTVKQTLAIDEAEINAIAQKFLAHPRNFSVGVGTTYFVAMVGCYLFKRYADLYVPAVSSDEFPRLVPGGADMHVLFFSQSGETYDTRMAIQAAKESGGATSAVVNVVGSSISRAVDTCIFQGSGPEICVVSTKAALSQIVILWQIALAVGRAKGCLTAQEQARVKGKLGEFADTLEQLLNEESGNVRHLAAQTKAVPNWLFMGKDIYYPIALESALKMKEVTYLHAEGLPAGFLKHGTLAMVDESLYSLFFLPHPSEHDLFRSSLNAMEEVKARRGKVITFCHPDNHEALRLADHYFYLPDLGPEAHPSMQLVLAQLFSYYSALQLGLNIDKPRNLAKSVTVG